jgi:hypothetical protein
MMTAAGMAAAASGAGEAPVSAPGVVSTTLPPAVQSGEARAIADGGARPLRRGQSPEEADAEVAGRWRATGSEDAPPPPSRANRAAVELYLEDRLRRQATVLTELAQSGRLSTQERMTVERILAAMPKPHPEPDAPTGA